MKGSKSPTKLILAFVMLLFNLVLHASILFIAFNMRKGTFGLVIDKIGEMLFYFLAGCFFFNIFLTCLGIIYISWKLLAYFLDDMIMYTKFFDVEAPRLLALPSPTSSVECQTNFVIFQMDYKMYRTSSAIFPTHQSIADRLMDIDLCQSHRYDTFYDDGSSLHSIGERERERSASLPALNGVSFNPDSEEGNAMAIAPPPTQQIPLQQVIPIFPNTFAPSTEPIHPPQSIPAFPIVQPPQQIFIEPDMSSSFLNNFMRKAALYENPSEF